MKNNQQLDEKLVISRFKEAISTIKKLPQVKVQGYFNSWPEIFYSSAEIRRMDRKEKILRPTPEAITRMEETISWLSVIKTTNERKLIWMRANNIPWIEICKIFGISRSNANKKYKKAILTITNNF